MRQPEARKAADLSRGIERVKSLDLDGLGLQWRNAFGRRAPKGLPKALLTKILIYRLQADALGDLDPEIARLVKSHAARGETDGKDSVAEGSGRAISETLSIKPGSVLVRDWSGRTHRVMALQVGFAWEGRNYRSLSEVARAITGTRWNGRRFFGVDQKADRRQSPPEVRGGTRPGAQSELTNGSRK